MAEPRLPEPMTPERAQKLAIRWRLASFAIILVGLGLGVAAAYVLALVPALLAISVSQETRHLGWRDGYRAARTEDLRRGAGELL